jgi:carbon monoxide dehydrogenase subunit G
MPSSSFEHSIAVDAPIGRVWDALMLPDTWAAIGPVQEVWDPVFDGPTLVGYRWSTTVGSKAFNGTARAVAHDRPTSYATDLDAGEMAGRISIELVERSPETEMLVRLDFQTKGLLSSMFFPLIRDAIAKGFPQQIEDFAGAIAD